MNLFDKIVLAVKGTAHNVVDATTDKNAMAEQALREMKEQLTNAKNALDQINGRALVQESEIAELKAQVTKYLTSAKQAKDKNELELAKACLEKKNVFQAKLNALEPAYASLKEEIKALEEQVADREQAVNDAQNKVELLQAQSEVADLKMTTAEALKGSGSSKDYGSVIEQLSDDVAKKDATATAKIARVKQESGADLDARIRKMQNNSSIDDELANL